MTKHGYISAAAVPAEPSAEVLTSALMLEKQAADAVKIRKENVEIVREEAEERTKGMIRPEPRGPGPYTCPSCGTRPWQPLWNNLCDRCGLQVALKKVGKMLVARCCRKELKKTKKRRPTVTTMMMMRQNQK